MNQYRLHFPLHIDSDIKNLMANAYGGVLHERENGVTGYFDLPRESKLIIEELQKEDGFEKYSDIAVIGIGGSSLGTKAVDSFLRLKRGVKNIHFLENPDPLHLREIFDSLQKEKTLFIVVSKSGSTIETISIFKTVIKHFGLDLQKDTKQIVVITDVDSPLHKFSQHFNIKSFAIPKNVGGRFSVLSAVGIVPLTIAGYDTSKMLLGAGNLIDRFFDMKEEHILQKAAFIYRNWEQFRMNVLFAYADELEDFGKWYVQLWGESLGKIDRSGRHIGPTPIAHIGSVDQHSFLQLIMEGPRDKTVTFLNIEDFQEPLSIPDISLPYLEKTDFVNGVSFNKLLNEECEATMESIMKQNIPVDRIVLPFIDEEAIGELIAYYELLTSVVGQMFGIDTYNQPGVELGKKILKARFEA